MEILSWIFFGPAKLIAWCPYAGAGIAGGLVSAQVWQHLHKKKAFDAGFFREAPVFAGLLWLIFSAFELQMSAISSQTNSQGTALRMDLVVIVPILYALTGAAIHSLVSRARKSADKTATKANE